MNALRDRVARFLADSSNSYGPNSPRQNSQTRPSIKGEKSFSSYFSFINPSAIFDGSKSQNASKRAPSAPPSKGYGWEPLGIEEESSSISEEDNNEASIPHGSVHEEKEKSNTHQKDGGYGSSRSSTNLNVSKKTIHPQTPQKALTNLLDNSVFITPELYEFFQSCLPNIVKGCQWVLLYSTLKHGISLHTLIRKSAELSGPCLLIVGDIQGAIFGGLLECPLRPTPKWKYQGTNQTFVFTTIYGEPRLFRPTGANRYYYLCLNDLLALGGGGTFALRLNEDLLSGTSGSCATFGNSCLAHKPEFQIKNIELWGFTHASQYLTCVKG